MLGWVDYAGYSQGDVPLEADIVEVMTPPTGGAIEVHVGDRIDSLCVSQTGSEPLLSVPFDSIAGENRARIALDSATHTPWDGTEPQT